VKPARTNIVMHTDYSARLHLIITGRVQGVFFRRAAAERARAPAIGGWARNLDDGSVEIVAEGRRANLELLLSWAHNGPRQARVDTVRAEWERSQQEFARFQVR
jgi:acylphosphatase